MKLNRHIWEEGSINRSVCGDEYDRVCDIAEQLEAELAGNALMDAEAESFISGQELVPKGTLAELAEAREEAKGWKTTAENNKLIYEKAREEIEKVREFLAKKLWQFIDDEIPSDTKDRKMLEMIENALKAE